MRFEPANRHVHVADRRRIACFGRLSKIDRSHQYAPGCQRLVDTGIIGPVAVVPRAAVHVNDGGKWSRPLGLIDASQPGFVCQVLIRDIPHIYFELVVVHGSALYNRERRSASSSNPLHSQLEKAGIKLALSPQPSSAVFSKSVE
jgi:hypothetical protein